MNLELMDDVLRTLGDADDVVEPILQRWPHDPGSLRFLRASANFIFTFNHAGSPRVLRLNHLSARATRALSAELNVIRHLRARGVRVAEPVASSAGRYVEHVPTRLGPFGATAFAFIRGEQPACSELTGEMFVRWGRALAALHNGVAGYAAPGRPNWQTHLDDIAQHLPPELIPAQRLLGAVRQQLSALPLNDATFGLIHFDFEPDNLVWQGPRVWAIDFDDCAYYPFVADIAFALRELFGDRPAAVDLGDARVQAFVRGYRELRRMEDAELSTVPQFLAAHNLLSFVRLGRSLAGGGRPDEPAWLSALRGRLERKRLEYLQGFAEATP